LASREIRTTVKKGLREYFVREEHTWIYLLSQEIARGVLIAKIKEEHIYGLVHSRGGPGGVGASSPPPPPATSSGKST